MTRIVIGFAPANEFYDILPTCYKHGVMKHLGNAQYSCAECGVTVDLRNVMILPHTAPKGQYALHATMPSTTAPRSEDEKRTPWPKQAGGLVSKKTLKSLKHLPI